MPQHGIEGAFVYWLNHHTLMDTKKKYGRTDNYRNLTRYTRDKTSFQGWRVCICRQRAMFTQYISDSAYHNSEEKSEAAARALRDEILEAIRTRPVEEVFAEYRTKCARRKKSRRRAGKGTEGKKEHATS